MVVISCNIAAIFLFLEFCYYLTLYDVRLVDRVLFSLRFCVGLCCGLVLIWRFIGAFSSVGCLR